MDDMNYTNDPRAVLIHFNPNHDPRTGRFTSNMGGVFGAKTPVDNSGDSEYNKNKNIFEKGKDAIERFLSRFGDQNASEININKRVGIPPEDIDRDLVSKINPNRDSGAPEFQTNCVNCAIAYSLGSQFGIEAEALGSDYQDIGDVYAIFQDAKPTPLPNVSIDSCIKSLPAGSSGIILAHNQFIDDQNNGHVVNYEKTIDGQTTLIDNQHDLIFSSDYEKLIPPSFVSEGYIDLSNARLSKKSTDKASKHVKFIEKEDDD